jgi:RNA polymerase sigma-70 factor (ECF subfamily)
MDEPKEPKEIEEKVLAAAARGDRTALAAIYDAYAWRLYRYFYSRLGNVADAEDLCAQTFLGVLEGLPRYRHRGQFSAWLFQIARNKAIDHFRRQRPTGIVDEMLMDPQAGRLLENVIDGQAVEKLKSLFRALDEDERELLRLRFVVDLSFVQMAALLGRNEDAVRKAVQRILARLQGQMEVNQ